MIDQDDRVLGDDALRFVDVLLDEMLGSAPRVVPAAPPRRGGRLMAAALVLLGLLVLFGTALLVREAPVPLQDPAPPPGASEAREALRRMQESVHTIEPLADVVLGEGQPARGLSAWDQSVAPARGPRIVDPRDPWARPDPGSVQFRPEVGAPVVESKSMARGTPEIGLLRDVLPGRGGMALRAIVRAPEDLADEPGQLQGLVCEGGSPAALTAALPRFPALRQVRLGALLDDAVAAALSNCRALEELEATAIDLSDSGLASLAGLPALHSLTLGGSLRDDVGPALGHLRRLRVLRLVAPWPGHANALLLVVRRLPLLRELQCALPAMPAAAAWSDVLLALPDLRRLGVVFDGGPMGDLARLAATLPVECLRLGGGELTTADLQTLLRSPTLRCLDLRGTSFSEPAASADALAAARNLRWLGLAFTNVDQTRMEVMRAALSDCVVQTETVLTRADGTRGFALHERRVPQ